MKSKRRAILSVLFIDFMLLICGAARAEEDRYSVMVSLKVGDEERVPSTAIDGLNTAKKNRDRIKREVARGAHAQSALELMGALSKDPEAARLVSYDGENLSLGFVFFNVTAEGERRLRALSQVKEVMRAHEQATARRP